MKQKTGRKLLSVLLTLAMAVGLMPGMSLTAYAEYSAQEEANWTLLTTIVGSDYKTTQSFDTTDGVAHVEFTGNVSQSENADHGNLWYSEPGQDFSMTVSAKDGYFFTKCVFHNRLAADDTGVEAYKGPFTAYTDGSWIKVQDSRERVRNFDKILAQHGYESDGVARIEVYGVKLSDIQYKKGQQFRAGDVVPAGVYFYDADEDSVVKVEETSTIYSMGRDDVVLNFGLAEDEDRVLLDEYWDDKTNRLQFRELNSSIPFVDAVAIEITDGTGTKEDPYVFTPIYPITFDSDGGSTTPGSQEVMLGKKVTAPSTNPTKSRCTFDGWYNGSKKWDFATDAINGGITLKAKWISHTVTYDGNGSTGGTVPIDSNSPYPDKETVTVLGNTGNLEKTNYAFDGWNTQADGKGTDYSAGATFAIEANTTLYAKWRPLHEHNYTYNSDGATITATCSANDRETSCPLKDNNYQATLTIGAPLHTTYGDDKEAAAVIVDANSIQGSASVSYYKATKDGDTYTKGDMLTSAPTDAGDYVAEIALSSAIASVGYTIVPATISSVAVKDITAPTATEVLDPAAATDTASVTLNNSGAITWEPAAPQDGKAEYAKTYKATVTAKAADNYTFADNDKITATVNGNAATVTKNPDGTLSISYAFAKTALNPVTIAAADKEVSYSADGIVIPVEGMFAIPDGAGEAAYSVADGTGTGIFDAQTGKLSVTKSGTFSVTVNTAETETHAASTASATLTVNKATVTVTALDQNISVGGTVPNLNNPVLGTHYTIEGLSGSDTVSLSLSLRYVDENGDTVVFDGNSVMSCFIRPVGLSETDNYNINYVNGTMTVREKGTQAISAENVTITYGETSKSVSAIVTDPTKGGGKISYAVKDGSMEYIDVDATTGALTIKKVPADGKAYVTVTASGTEAYEQATMDVVVTINKADPTVNAPTAKHVTYTGSAQELVTAGTATGGEMRYALGADASKAPAEGWGTTIPTAADAGTYHVWYRVVGDANHLDAAPARVDARVAPRVVSLRWSGTKLTYDGAKQGPKATVANLAPGDECSVTVSGAAKAAGTHTATATGLSNPNYALPAKATTQFAIAKAKLTVTAKDKRIKQGDAPANAGVTYKGLVGSDKAGSLGGKLSFDYGGYKKGGKAGKYEITPKGLSSKNYDIAYRAGTLTVAKASAKLPASVPVTAKARVGGRGWSAANSKGVCGTTAKSLALTGLKLSLKGAPLAGSIQYRSHVQGTGWERSWSSDGDTSGAAGKRTEAVRIRLTGAMAKQYDVWYRAHVRGIGWMAWARDGEAAGTTGMSRRAEAVQVVVLKKGSKAPAKDYKGVRQDSAKAFLSK